MKPDSVPTLLLPNSAEVTRLKTNSARQKRLQTKERKKLVHEVLKYSDLEHPSISSNQLYGGDQCFQSNPVNSVNDVEHVSVPHDCSQIEKKT